MALHTAQSKGCLTSELQAQSGATPVLWVLSPMSQ